MPDWQVLLGLWFLLSIALGSLIGKAIALKEKR